MSDQEREKIAYDSDLVGVVRIPSGDTVAEGNIPEFGTNGTIKDSGKSVSSLVTSSDIDDAVSSCVSEAVGGIWDSVKSVEAWRAYQSPAWSSGTSYSVGDLCIYSGAGYRCKEATSSQSFISSEWEEVLTASGKSAIDGILSNCLNSGMARLTDLAPDFGNNEYYENDLVIKNGILQICTASGFGTEATFRAGKVEESIVNRISAAMDSLNYDIRKGVIAYGRDYIEVSNGTVSAIHGSDSIELAKTASLSGKADTAAIDAAYDSTRGYSIDETCTHGGKWYRCKADVAPGSDFSVSSWDEITVKQALSGGFTQVNADWDETNSADPAYIKNKPHILSPYKIEEISAINVGGQGYVQNSVSYKLKDRTVNVIRPRVGVSENIRLLAPDQLDSNYARDFVVVIYAITRIDGESEDDVDTGSSSSDSSDPPDPGSGDEVEVRFGASIECYDSRYNLSKLTAIIGKWVSYKFLETGLGNQNVFLVTGYSDPAYQKAIEIDRALDAILSDGGAGGDFEGGVYIPGDDGKLHKIEAVTDEFGDVNISVEKEGVVR